MPSFQLVSLDPAPLARCLSRTAHQAIGETLREGEPASSSVLALQHDQWQLPRKRTCPYTAPALD